MFESHIYYNIYVHLYFNVQQKQHKEEKRSLLEK